MLSKKARSVFNFCTRWNFPLAKLAAERKNCMSQLCYVSTQQYRMYLRLTPAGLEYVPCIKEEHQWMPVNVQRRVPTPNASMLFRDVVTMEELMTKHFFLQFPEAEVSFFEDIPTDKEVRAAIAANPKGDILSERFYIFHTEEDKAVDDADGIAVILVAEGNLMVPYSYLNGREKDFSLQLYRAKLHPDSYIQYYGNKFWQVVDHVISRLQELSWGGFRRFINQRIN